VPPPPPPPTTTTVITATAGENEHSAAIKGLWLQLWDGLSSSSGGINSHRLVLWW